MYLLLLFFNHISDGCWIRQSEPRYVLLLSGCMSPSALHMFVGGQPNREPPKHFIRLPPSTSQTCQKSVRSFRHSAILWNGGIQSSSLATISVDSSHHRPGTPFGSPLQADSNSISVPEVWRSYYYPHPIGNSMKPSATTPQAPSATFPQLTRSSIRTMVFPIYWDVLSEFVPPMNRSYSPPLFCRNRLGICLKVLVHGLPSQHRWIERLLPL